MNPDFSMNVFASILLPSAFVIMIVFKLAVVIQQIYARYVRGQTDDPRFASMGTRVAKLARIATELAANSSLPATRGEGQGEGPPGRAGANERREIR